MLHILPYAAVYLSSLADSSSFRCWHFVSQFTSCLTQPTICILKESIIYGSAVISLPMAWIFAILSHAVLHCAALCKSLTVFPYGMMNTTNFSLVPPRLARLRMQLTHGQLTSAACRAWLQYYLAQRQHPSLLLAELSLVATEQTALSMLQALPSAWQRVHKVKACHRLQLDLAGLVASASAAEQLSENPMKTSENRVYSRVFDILMSAVHLHQVFAEVRLLANDRLHTTTYEVHKLSLYFA